MKSPTAISHKNCAHSARIDSRWLSAMFEHGRRQPDRAAVVVIDKCGAGENILTYRALVNESAKLSSVLAESLKPGQVVMLAAENGLEYVVWFSAALRAGMRLFPVYCGSTAAECAASAEQSGAAAIIARDDMDAAGALPIQRFSLELAGNHPEVSHARAPAAAAGAILLQSSGTTGAPRIVLRESDALDAVAMNVARAAQLCADDRVLAVMPLSHSYGVDVLLATLFAGATLQVMPAFDAVAAAEQLAEYVTVFPGVPFMFEAISRIAPPRRPAQLRLAFSAGTQLPARIVDSFLAAWGCTIGQLYGATELGSVTFNHPDSSEFNPACVGIPMHGVSIRILDPEDHTRQLASTKCGHVAIAAPSMLSGYVNRQSTSDELRLALADGHVLTGDLGSVDERGRLFITGRLKLLIDIGGFKVNPLEIEAVSNSHPDVVESVAMSMSLSDTVTRMRAVFVPRDPARSPDPEELRKFLRQRLSAHKIPRVIECVQSLPRSPSGKIQRHLAANP